MHTPLRVQGEQSTHLLTLNGFNWAKMVRVRLLHFMICRLMGEWKPAPGLSKAPAAACTALSRHSLLSSPAPWLARPACRRAWRLRGTVAY